jgi:type II secretory pathway component GspD/PulD (secretin)
MTLKQTHRAARVALALAIFPLGLSARAQDQPDKPSTEDQASSKPVDHCNAIRSSATETRTFYFTNVSQPQDANEIMIAIRNILCPSIKIYFVAAQNALVVEAPPDQLALAEKLITDLDRPRKTYRLLYTLTEIDAGKTIGTQHFSMIVVAGQHTSMKEGDKVPVATGTFATENSTSQTQFTYLDIGMNFDSTIDESANGVRLQSKVEQSSLGQPSTIAGIQEPVVRQTVLQGTSFLSLDKPVMLGSVDVPNSTRHFDIAVALEQIK